VKLIDEKTVQEAVQMAKKAICEKPLENVGFRQIESQHGQWVVAVATLAGAILTASATDQAN
jgi:hypothetical protein